MKNKIRIIKDGFHKASFNMAADELLFREAQMKTDNEAVIRLYGFDSQAVTVGICQKLKNDASLMDYFKENTDFTRRITGGGAVLHNDDLTYSIITHNTFHPSFNRIDTSYQVIHSSIKNAARKIGKNIYFHDKSDNNFMGTKECFINPVKNDLMYNGQKIAGAAQKRRRGYILHQGSILLRPFLRNGETFLNLFQRMSDALIDSFCEYFCADRNEYPLTEDELKEVYILEEEKYSVKEWVLRN